MPVVNNKLKLLGGLATVGIRGQVETDQEHARTVPIFVDLKTFQKQLKVKTKGVYPILVARDGRIAWRGEDAIDMDEITELEAAVVEVLDAPVPPVTDHPDVDDAEEEDPSEAVSEEALSEETASEGMASEETAPDEEGAAIAATAPDTDAEPPSSEPSDDPPPVG